MAEAGDIPHVGQEHNKTSPETQRIADSAEVLKKSRTWLKRKIAPTCLTLALTLSSCTMAEGIGDRIMDKLGSDEETRTEQLEPEIRQDNCTYIVMPNDSLYKIAEERLGDPSLFPELAEHNAIENPSRIEVGQVLDICINGESIVDRDIANQTSDQDQQAPIERQAPPEQSQQQPPQQAPQQQNEGGEVQFASREVPQPQGELSPEARKRIHDATTKAYITGVNAKTGEIESYSCTAVNVSPAGKVTFATHCIDPFMSANGTITARIQVGHPDWKLYDVATVRYVGRHEGDIAVAQLRDYEGDMGYVEAGNPNSLQPGETVFTMNYQGGSEAIRERRLVYLGRMQVLFSDMNGDGKDDLVDSMVLADNESGVSENDRISQGASGSLVFDSNGRYISGVSGIFIDGDGDYDITRYTDALGYTTNGSINRLINSTPADLIGSLTY